MTFGVHQVPTGRPKGAINAKTQLFKEALTNLLEHAAPQMVGWLDDLARGRQDDDGKWIVNPNPDRALSHIGSLAEYVHPKLSRAENINKTVGILQIVLEAGKAQQAALNATGEVLEGDSQLPKVTNEQPLPLSAEQQLAIGSAVSDAVAQVVGDGAGSSVITTTS